MKLRDPFNSPKKVMKSYHKTLLLLHLTQFVFAGVSFATIHTVNNSNDSGAGSLRDIIVNQVSSGDTIIFSASTNGNPILLNSQISIQEPLIILGNGMSNTIIDGLNFDGNLFYISDQCSFKALTFRNGGKELIDAPTIWGGAIFFSNTNDTLLLEDCKFKGNRAYLGGAIRIQEGHLSISHCIFDGNESLIFGGAINARSSIAGGSNILVKNSLFFNNFSDDSGGAIFAESTTNWQVINCTFVNNSTATSGGGFRNAGSGQKEFYNNIFYQNSASSGPDISSGSISNAFNNLLSDYTGAGFTSGTNGNTTGDPKFKNIASNDFSLKFGSAAINAGQNSFASSISHDLNSNHRVNAALIDIGAYEFTSRLYVDKNATGDQNGANWMDAFTDLSSALNASDKGTEVWVAQNSYTPGGSRSTSFVIPDSVNVYGGFDGTESLLSERDWTKNKTILDGNNYHYHLVKFINTSWATSLDGFYITGGRADRDAGVSIVEEQYGGGVIVKAEFNETSFAEITNCKIYENTALRGGGGISTFGESTGLTSVKISNTILHKNSVLNGSGGGVLFANLSELHDLEMVNCAVTQNYCSGFGSYGGGIFMIINSGAHNLKITNNSVVSNAARYGGGIYIRSTGGSLHSDLLNTLIYTNNSWSSNPDELENSIGLNAATADFQNCHIEHRTITTNGNLSGDIKPNVVNALVYNSDSTAFADARLTHCSPLINAGTTSGAPSTDLWGNPRTGNPDIGAFEFGGNSNSILYVKEGAAAGDGSSWSKAFGNLQAAIYASNSCQSEDSIWVAAGTYYPTESASRWVSFKLDTNTHLFGGFAGVESPTFDLSQRDFILNETILSGDIGVKGDSSDNSINVVELTQAQNSSLIDGFSIEKGNSDSGAGGVKGRNGAGILNYARYSDHDLKVKNCIFRNNYSESSGAGIYSSVFGGNTNAVTIENCDFLDNSAGFSGSCLENDGSGGGVATAEITNSKFRGSDGNAVRNIAFLSSEATLICEGCQVTGNEIPSTGAGISNVNSDGSLAMVKIVNGTFSGNKAFQASALYNNDGLMEVSNSIFWANDHLGTGGDIITSSGGTTTISYSMREDINDNTNGNIPSVNPKFAYEINPLNSPSSDGDFSLKNCSLVADKGSNDSVSVSLDLAGLSRIFNDSGLPTAIVDLGAYEHQGFDAPQILIVSDLDNGNTDLTELVANETIEANGDIIVPSNVLLRAGKSISMNPGFVAQTSTVFRAEIGTGCP
ncbi:choice-of-anchor Q domain-containing protein [Jiulongibacter sp. NS-SX5]|uniref:choice-of-anchor Q domain-containing protein n=1 Tax=Jiulongibacter sp. NS-SX5 TaxID=3463854 RepID=UPI0040594F82